MVKVKDWSRSKAYYEAAFKPLGYELLLDKGSWGGFTQPGQTTGRIYVKQGCLALLCLLRDVISYIKYHSKISTYQNPNLVQSETSYW